MLETAIIGEEQARAATQIHDLRSALEVLRAAGQLVMTSAPADPYLEIAGIYKRVGAGTPVAPPTKLGPAMLFTNVSGFEMPVVTGVLASRERAAMLLGSTPTRLPWDLLAALEHPIPPLCVPAASAPCQEVVLTPPFDIRSILPVLTLTELDAGPYITMGLIRAEDPAGGKADVTIHRICLQGPDRLSVFLMPGRHIEEFRRQAEALGQPLPISISIGLDPAVYIGACFEPPTTPLGFDELTVAGGLRGRPVELVDCVSVPAKAIARAEIVIEGEILPGERIREDVQTGTGWAMPEFPGYMGRAQQEVPIVRVTAITHRRGAIFEALVNPGEEHANLAGIPTEASITQIVERTMPGRLQGVYCHPAGGGKYVAIISIRKLSVHDEGRPRQAALAAFAAFTELKHVILVDDDVDIFDTNDVLWAMTTRYQGDVSTVLVPAVRCHALDPTQRPEFNPLLPAVGTTCKTVFDCTVPWGMKDAFRRAQFKEVEIPEFEDAERISEYL
jgi:gallate decarboxylase subunit C